MLTNDCPNAGEERNNQSQRGVYRLPGLLGRVYRDGGQALGHASK